MRPLPDGRGLRVGVALSPALLLLLLLLLLPPPPPPLLGRLWAAGTPAPAPGARQDGALGVGRVKRGWVWNQFFVVEEYTGTEPLYVGKVKWDPAPTILHPGPGRHPLVDTRDPSSPASLRLSPWRLLPAAPQPGADTRVLCSAPPTCPMPFSSSSPFYTLQQSASR